jgi:hypothetical protein
VRSDAYKDARFGMDLGEEPNDRVGRLIQNRERSDRVALTILINADHRVLVVGRVIQNRERSDRVALETSIEADHRCASSGPTQLSGPKPTRALIGGT